MISSGRVDNILQKTLLRLVAKDLVLLTKMEISSSSQVRSTSSGCLINALCTGVGLGDAKSTIDMCAASFSLIVPVGDKSIPTLCSMME